MINHWMTLVVTFFSKILFNASSVEKVMTGGPAMHHCLNFKFNYYMLFDLEEPLHKSR